MLGAPQSADGLQLVNLPAEIRQKIAIGDAPVYFFESVLKVKANGHVHDKILAITDRALFICSTRGSVKRTVPVSSIQQVLRKAPNYLGFRIPSDLDLLLLFKAPDDAEKICKILSVTSRILGSTGGVEILDVRPSTVLTMELNLGNMPGLYGSPSPGHGSTGGAWSPTHHPDPSAAVGAPRHYDDGGSTHDGRRRGSLNLDSALATLRSDAAREAAGGGYRGGRDARHSAAASVVEDPNFSRRDRDVELSALQRRASPPAGGASSEYATLSAKVDKIAEALARLHRVGDGPAGGFEGHARGGAGGSPGREGAAADLAVRAAGQAPSPTAAGQVTHSPSGATAPLTSLSSLPQMLFDEDELILKYEPEVDFEKHPLTHDPRTGLALIDVPDDFLPLFQDMQACVMHFFGGCNILTETGVREPAVVVVTDEFLYAVVVEVDPMASDDGQTPLQRKWLRRCFAVSHIDSIMFTERGYVGFVVPSDFDLLLLASSTEQMYDLLRVVTVINRYRATGSSRTPLMPVRHDTESFLPPYGTGLSLATPPQYEVQVGPLHMRKGLEECVTARARLLNLERRRVNQTALQTLNTRVAAIQAAMAQDLFALVSQDLDHLHRHLQDAVSERDSLRAQVAAYESEIRQLRGR